MQIRASQAWHFMCIAGSLKYAIIAAPPIGSFGTHAARRAVKNLRHACARVLQMPANLQLVQGLTQQNFMMASLSLVSGLGTSLILSLNSHHM
jgi:hypothetical protein